MANEEKQHEFVRATASDAARWLTVLKCTRCGAGHVFEVHMRGHATTVQITAYGDNAGHKIRKERLDGFASEYFSLSLDFQQKGIAMKMDFKNVVMKLSPVPAIWDGLEFEAGATRPVFSLSEWLDDRGRSSSTGGITDSGEKTRTSNAANRYCPGCGVPTVSGGRFCVSCGTAIG